MSTKARRAGSETFSPLLNEFEFMALNRSPGYALSLVAESTTAALHCAEAVSQPGVAPEDIALQATRSLLNEIERGGCVDQKHQILVLLLMVLGSEDVGRCRMAEPTERT
jgi:RNA 3'-terminal phosphate cyclase-like protein